MNKNWFQRLIEWFQNLGKKQIDKAAPQLQPSEEPPAQAVLEKDPRPSYYRWAENEIGVSESSNASRVIWYIKNFTKLGKEYWTTKTSWCAALVSAALKESGYSSLLTSWARDYQSLRAIARPQIYCIMGFERNGPGGDSHVGFWTGKETETHYEILGGNQGNKVCKAWYKKSDLIYCVMPDKVA